MITKPLNRILALCPLPAALATLLIASGASAAPVHGPIENYRDGSRQCLAWQPGSAAPVVSACDGTRAQDWAFVPSASYYQIRNAGATQARGQDMCLRTDAGNTGMGRVSIDPCADGDARMSEWRFETGPGGRIGMLNAYRISTGRDEVLAIRAGGPDVAMQFARGEPSASWVSAQVFAPPQRLLLGKKTALVLAARFGDDAAQDAEVIRKAVFGNGDDHASLRHYIEVASHGKATLDGTVLDGVDLGARPATCGSGALRDAARQAALARGVDPAQFDYLLVDFPKLGSCGWAGLAAQPGNWILSNGSGHGYWMWTHEFGHSLGAAHPGSLVDCPSVGGTVQIDAACRQGKVDDPSDTVGGGGRRLYPGSYQLFSGWLDQADVPELRASGTYRLAPLFGSQPGAKGYRIARTDGTQLWLEFRQPLRGFDDWKADDPFVNGVIVRTVKHRRNALTNTLVDTTPGSPGGMKDAPLMPGHALHDTLSGKIVTVDSVGPDGAVITVKNDGVLLPEATIAGPAQADANTTVALSGAASIGERLQYVWSAPADVVLKPAGSSASVIAPPAGKDRELAIGLTVINGNGYAAGTTHVLKVKARETITSWDPHRTYSTPCQKVTYAGKSWLNGWWVLGDVPGQGGEWGPWRELGVKNMHAQCKGK